MVRIHHVCVACRKEAMEGLDCVASNKLTENEEQDNEKVVHRIALTRVKRVSEMNTT